MVSVLRLLRWFTEGRRKFIPDRKGREVGDMDRGEVPDASLRWRNGMVRRATTLLRKTQLELSLPVLGSQMPCLRVA